MKNEGRKTSLKDPRFWILVLVFIGVPIWGLYGPVPKDEEGHRRRVVWEQQQSCR